MKGEKEKGCLGPARKNIEEYPAGGGPIIERIWGQRNSRFSMRGRGTLKGRKPVTAPERAVYSL